MPTNHGLNITSFDYALENVLWTHTRVGNCTLERLQTLMLSLEMSVLCVRTLSSVHDRRLILHAKDPNPLKSVLVVPTKCCVNIV